MTLTLPSGWSVELAGTSTGFPPDDSSGMSLNSSALWCRLMNPSKVNRTTGPKGWDSGWHQCSGSSLTRARLWWDLVESEADIREAWLGCVGGVWPPPRYDDVWKEGVEWLGSLS